MLSAQSLDIAEEERRARKLEAAKKKLKSFRATRTSVPSSSSSHHSRTVSGPSSKSSLTSKSPRIPSTVLPLTTETGGNVIVSHNRVNSKGKGKATGMMDGMDMGQPLGIGSGIGHQRVRSGGKASGRHRRQNSSISAVPPHSLYRPVIPLSIDLNDDDDPEHLAGKRMGTYKFALPVPREIITTPATPLIETNDLSDPFSSTLPVPSTPPKSSMNGEEDVAGVKQRLSAFSFGSKPSLSPGLGLNALSPSRSPTASPNRRQRLQQPLLSSIALRSRDLNFPSSPFLSTSDPTSVSAGHDKLAQALSNGLTPSRPPSLLFTNATPLLASPSAPGRLSHPSISSLAGLDSPSPSTPPTPARRKHSHTRSNSISLSNLKIGSIRPVSLGIPSSPSFPSSPGSPNSPDDIKAGSGRDSGSSTGTRLKFEPSEAEMAKEESRRKALEKLTGSSPLSSPIIPETQERTAEISLPDLEDDTSSIGSSSRPLSSAWGGSSGSSSSSSFSFGRPNSFNLSSQVNSATAAMESSPFPAWPADDAVPMSFDKWSSGFKEESLGFGMDLMPKRGSFQGALAVLPEVEETEEDCDMGGDNNDDSDNCREGDISLDIQVSITAPTFTSPIVQPTPSRLRELHLLSSGPIGTPLRSTIDSDSPATTRPLARPTSTSPTKGYGTIGRGRPRPLSGISSAQTSSTSTSSPLSANVITPKTARQPNPRRRLSSGRPSSISYKKDNRESGIDGMSMSSSLSSRWSINSRSMVSPPPPADLSLSSISSPPMTSPGSSNWAHVPRSSGRPCPRPKSLVGLGIGNSHAGAGRILSEVIEKDESGDNGSASEVGSGGLGLGLGLGLGDGWQSAPIVPNGSDRGFTFRSFGSMDMGIVSPDLGDEAGRRSMDSEADMGWRDHMLEVEMERDALREDVDGWRERCKSLEDKLDEEKKESAVLRERLRKLSDRLLTLSTTPRSPVRQLPTSPARESRLILELKDQLFSLTSAFELEKQGKEAAQYRIEQLESQLSSSSRSPAGREDQEWSFKPYQPLSPSTFEIQQPSLHTPILTESPLIPSRSPLTDIESEGYNHTYPWPSTPIVTPATPAMLTPRSPQSTTFASPSSSSTSQDHASPQCDINTFRMKAWGFPSTTSTPSSSIKQSKRESFFGLSKVPAMTAPVMAEEEMYDGVDLPPFVLPVNTTWGLSATTPPGMFRAVSDPVVLSVNREEGIGGVGLIKSASTTSFSTSALSLISGYMSGRNSPSKAIGGREGLGLDIGDDIRDRSSDEEGEERRVVGLDMRAACRCCVGEVFEI